MHDIPESIGPFEIIRKLGSNGWLETFEGFGKSPPHSRYVVRRMIPAMRDNPETVEMFRRNIGKLARLCHPSIFAVEYHDPDNLFYAVQFHQGMALDGLLKHQRVTINGALSIVRDIGSAFSHAHERGIVHGELSPGCIFLTDDDRSMLKNFCDYSKETPRDVVYFSPEIIRGEPIDSRTDVHGLGLLLLELSSPNTPYLYGVEWLEYKTQGPPPSARENNKEVPVYLDAVIRRAMAVNPNERFQTVSGFLEAIETVPRDIPRGESMNGFGLAVISGERRGTLVPIFHPNFSVGRTPGNQFVLSEEQAAVHQFRLIWEPDGNQWFLQACGHHPTRLNGLEYGYSHTALPPVKPGDVISFGQTDFFFLEL